MEQKQTEKQTLNSILTSAIVKSRLAIIVVLVSLIVVAVLISIFVAVKNNAIEEGLARLDAIEFRYDALDTSAASYGDDRLALSSEAVALADESSGVVKVRSLLFAAEINFELENWTEAFDLYLNSYEEDTESYTAPIALYNAGISSEELQNIDDAVTYLSMAIEYDDFALKARAMFNLGRIEDSRENYAQAAESYQKLIDDFPSTTWANLARSRLITLRTESKVD